MATHSPSIEVRGLTKRYGKTVAVDQLSFAVQPGRVTGFLGPNGAGKSTTLRMILGLEEPHHETRSRPWSCPNRTTTKHAQNVSKRATEPAIGAASLGTSGRP